MDISSNGSVKWWALNGGDLLFTANNWANVYLSGLGSKPWTRWVPLQRRPVPQPAMFGRLLVVCHAGG